jgi:hypothetical protein
MSAPANLFIETPDVQDLSLTRLSTDVKAWPEEIVQKFKERIPESAGVQMIVKFTKQDPENATATGAIMLNTAGKTGVIPVIVREGMMHPLDVMIAEGRELPLTPDFFAAIFAQNGAFDSIEEYPVTFGGGIQGFAGSDPSITNTTYPPTMTRYASDRTAEAYYRQAQKKLAGLPSILDSILPTITPAQVEDFKKTIEKNAASLVGYKKNKTFGLVTKITDTARKSVSGMATELKHDGAEFHHVKKPFIMARSKNPGQYKILANEYDEFSPAFRPVNKREMRSFISDFSEDVDTDDFLRELDVIGERVVSSKANVSGLPKINDPKGQDPFLEDAKEFGAYTVRMKDGNYTKGYVVPHVIDFDQKRLPYKMFLGKEIFSIQDKIVGMKIRTKTFVPDYSDPAAGESGVFLYRTPTGAVATGPVVVHRIVVDPEDFIYLECADHNGKELTIKTNPAMHLKRIAKAADQDNTYLMPHEMKWVRLGKFMEVSSTKELFHTTKEASAIANEATAMLISQGYGSFSVRGLDAYTKTAGWDATLLDGPQVKFLLHSLGKELAECDQILKVATSHGHLKVTGLQRVPLAGSGISKTASVEAKKEKLAGLLRRDLFKEAALVESAQTVDSLLALNFVNPDNIAKMVSKIPQLKATISACASLLLASRLGMGEIPEQSTSTAMMRLLEVTDGLEKLRASQQTQAAQ